MVAGIVAKLMAKNAEERYQSLMGLQYDLSQYWTQWKKPGEIKEFELRQQHVLIPEKLYGRETEVQSLLFAFECVASNTSELMLIAGFAKVVKESDVVAQCNSTKA